MSYPDLIEQDGKYWITETNKADARVHEIPNEFLNALWSQFEIKTVAKESLVAEWNEDEIQAALDAGKFHLKDIDKVKGNCLVNISLHWTLSSDKPPKTKSFKIARSPGQQ